MNYLHSAALWFISCFAYHVGGRSQSGGWVSEAGASSLVSLRDFESLFSVFGAFKKEPLVSMLAGL